MQSDRRIFQLEELVPDPIDDQKEIYRIGDLAREFDVTLRTLRFYEDRGLLHPQRAGSTRLYSQRERARLKVILLAKRVGFPLTEIQEIMDVYDQRNPDEAELKAVVAKFRGQMSVLENQRKDLDRSIEELQETVDFLEGN